MKPVHDALTENDNDTYCVLRILGCVGVAMVGTAMVLGAAAFEVGAGVAAIITSVGASLRLKGEK